MGSLGYYYSDGGLGSAAYIYGFYSQGNKVLMVYFTPQCNYQDFPMINGILISQDQYQLLTENAKEFVTGYELDEDILNDIFYNSDYVEVSGMSAFDNAAEIIDVILSNSFARDTADAWYNDDMDYFDNLANGSLGSLIFDDLEAAVGEDAAYNLMDKLNAECSTYSQMLKQIRKYLS